MPDAPVVTYPVGRSAALGAGLVVVGALGWMAAFSMLFWPFAQAGSAWKASILIASCVAASAALAWFWWRQVDCVLRWDGAGWWLGAPGSPREQGGDDARVQVRLDAQRWMLLWFKAPEAPRGTWLWAQASSDPARWHLLRCALYLPQSSTDRARWRDADAERA